MQQRLYENVESHENTFRILKGVKMESKRAGLSFPVRISNRCWTILKDGLFFKLNLLFASKLEQTFV